MACRQKMLMFGIFKACTSKFVYYKLYQRKLKVITWEKYSLHFLIRPLDFSLQIREDESNLYESTQKNLEAMYYIFKILTELIMAINRTNS